MSDFWTSFGHIYNIPVENFIVHGRSLIYSLSHVTESVFSSRKIDFHSINSFTVTQNATYLLLGRQDLPNPIRPKTERWHGDYSFPWECR